MAESGLLDHQHAGPPEALSTQWRQTVNLGS